MSSAHACLIGLAAALGLLLAACTPDPASGDATAFRVTGSSPPGTPWALQWHRFAETLAADERLALEPALYIHAQLGDPERTLQSVRRGRIQMGGFPLSAVAGLVPEVALLHAPFLFESEAQVDHVIDEHLQAAFEPLFAAQGLKILNWTEAGWLHLFGQKPLSHPAALAGYPVRSQPTLGSRVWFSALAADVRPIPYGDLLSSLQTGLVRGGDSNTLMYLAAGLVDEAPELTLTAHVFEVGVILVNLAWWTERSADEQAAIREALGTRTRLRAEVAAQTDAALAAAVASGRVSVHRPDEAERAAWQERAPAVRARLVREIGGDAERIDAELTRALSAWEALTTSRNL
ncbi:MAG: TRAP transporter substrate-binding protein [Gammaproteobacteria bacterium]|nr:MAG: TRAP transporter substrate-binding protein [Gammaproteobacteria bacterium]